MKNGRCRVHGGASTGIRTEEGRARHRAAVLKHGRWTNEAVEAARLRGEARRMVASLRGVLREAAPMEGIMSAVPEEPEPRGQSVTVAPEPPEPTSETLLRELRALFRTRGVDRLPTAEIVAALGARLGRPLTAHRLARTLKPYAAMPRQYRVSGRRAWGYYQSDLAERRDDDPPVESRDADRLALAAAVAHRGGR